MQLNWVYFYGTVLNDVMLHTALGCNHLACRVTDVRLLWYPNLRPWNQGYTELDCVWRMMWCMTLVEVWCMPIVEANVWRSVWLMGVGVCETCGHCWGVKQRGDAWRSEWRMLELEKRGAWHVVGLWPWWGVTHCGVWVGGWHAWRDGWRTVGCVTYVVLCDACRGCDRHMVVLGTHAWVRDAWWGVWRMAECEMHSGLCGHVVYCGVGNAWQGVWPNKITNPWKVNPSGIKSVQVWLTMKAVIVVNWIGWFTDWIGESNPQMLTTVLWIGTASDRVGRENIDTEFRNRPAWKHFSKAQPAILSRKEASLHSDIHCASEYLFPLLSFSCYFSCSSSSTFSRFRTIILDTLSPAQVIHVETTKQWVSIHKLCYDFKSHGNDFFQFLPYEKVFLEVLVRLW